MKIRSAIMAVIIGGSALSAALLVRGIPPSDTKDAQGSSQTKPPAPVEVVQASERPLSATLDVTGSVEPYRVARMASPAEGPVLDLRVREGDRVRKGQALLSIGRSKGTEALVSSLREELKKEAENLRRTRRLVESGSLSSEHLDQARASHERIRAEVVRAEEAREDHAITAPWEGVVSRVAVKEGEFVAPRAELLEIYDPSSLLIRAAVPERYAAEVRTGLEAEVHLDAYPDRTLKGEITRVYPYLDSRLRTRTMEITLGKGVDLLPGMFARLTIFIRTVQDAVTVPVEALLTGRDGRAVFVVKDGKAEKRRVEIGIEENSRIEVVKGVLAGNTVIVGGNENLKNGDPVRVSRGQEAGVGGE